MMMRFAHEALKQLPGDGTNWTHEPDSLAQHIENIMQLVSETCSYYITMESLLTIAPRFPLIYNSKTSANATLY